MLPVASSVIYLIFMFKTYLHVSNVDLFVYLWQPLLQHSGVMIARPSMEPLKLYSGRSFVKSFTSPFKKSIVCLLQISCCVVYKVYCLKSKKKNDLCTLFY